MTRPLSMRAAIVTAYGAPDVVQILPVPRPGPGPGEVLVEVRATTVSSGDWRIRSQTVPRGFGTLLRLAFGWRRPRRPIFGTELSGTIAAVGEGVERFTVGDAVVAFPGAEMGAHAEYVVLREDGRILPKPASLSFEEAAAMCFGGVTAVHYLRDRAKVDAGARVLIVGAGGAVGSAAVQVALALGAEVTGVASAEAAEIVRSLGVDRFIDYRSRDFTRDDARYDVILDCVGATDYRACRRVLAPGGTLLRVVAGLGGALAAPFQGRLSGHRVIAGVSAERIESMTYLAELAESGRYRPLVDGIYPFAAIAEAHARVDTGHKHGSVVVDLG